MFCITCWPFCKAFDVHRVTQMTKHVAIIGNGIAGITAAQFIRKMSDYWITVIPSGLFERR